jgi:hypothetical protein
MADLLAVFTTLLYDLRTSLPKADASPAEVEDALSAGAPASTAQQIFEAKRRSPKFTEVSDEDLWHALTESLVEALKADEKAAPAIAQSNFDKLLTTIASEANRVWLVIIPANGEGDTEIADVLSTAAADRIIVAASHDADQLDVRFAKACERFGATVPTSALPTSVEASALFVVETRGAEASATRQALRSLNVGRDALRISVHLQPGKTDLDQAQQSDAQTSLTDIVLLDTARRQFATKIERNIDTLLGPVAELSNAKVRALYDIAARILEACSEDTPAKKQIDLIWRLARSIRIFSRAVGVANLDIRFLLTLVAFETVLNRADAPIAEALSEYGALIAASGVGERVELAKELKSAYNLRSRFVHEGRLPSEQLDEEKLRRASSIVFRTWAEIMRRFLPLGDQRLTDEVFFGKLVRLKFGATFEETFTS